MSVRRKYFLLFLSIIVFCVLLAVGFNLAQRKPVWNDEILTQTQAVDQLSYGAIAMGIIKGEGNNHPLFYLGQKVMCDIVRYKFPKPWEGEYLFADQRSQFIMRIGPNVFMASSLTLIFYFFSCYYSIRVGLYALVVALLSPMTWIYWVEARPYSLWFLLSVTQSLLLVQFIKKDKSPPKALSQLVVLHVLLALTTMASSLQIIVASVFIFMLGNRQWRQYVELTALPLVFVAFYYFQSGKFMLNMPSSWAKLIYPHLAVDQMVFFMVYILFLVIYALKVKKIEAGFMRAGEVRTYLVFLLLIVVATIGYFGAQAFVHIEHPHNTIKDRYFIYLTPVVIIATALFSVDLVRAFRRDPWMMVNVALALAGFLMVRFFNMYLEVAHSNLILNYFGEYW